MSTQTDFGNGSLNNIPETTPLDEFEASEIQPIVTRQLKKCACGHTVPIEWVMTTAHGSACPDCYDRMED